MVALLLQSQHPFIYSVACCLMKPKESNKHKISKDLFSQKVFPNISLFFLLICFSMAIRLKFVLPENYTNQEAILFLVNTSRKWFKLSTCKHSLNVLLYFSFFQQFSLSSPHLILFYKTEVIM